VVQPDDRKFPRWHVVPFRCKASRNYIKPAGRREGPEKGRLCPETPAVSAIFLWPGPARSGRMGASLGSKGN
jgi:hypothetical protein